MSWCRLRIAFCYFLNYALENVTLCSRKGLITTLSVVSMLSKLYLSIISALFQRCLRIVFCYFLNYILENAPLSFRKRLMTTLSVVSMSSKLCLSIVSDLSHGRLRTVLLFPQLYFEKHYQCALGKDSLQLSELSQHHLSIISVSSQHCLSIISEIFPVISSFTLWKMLYCVLEKGSSPLTASSQCC